MTLTLSKAVCSVNNCARGVIAKGFCQTHYNRARNGVDLHRPLIEKKRVDTTYWTPVNLAWFAGLFEGEGCFPPAGRGLRMTVGMTDKDVIQRLHTVAGFGAVYGPFYRAGARKPLWTWSAARSDYVYALIVAIYPHLFARRAAKAEQLIRLFASTGPVKTRIHGTRARWQTGCRCHPCCEASRKYWREWNKRSKQL